MAKFHLLAPNCLALIMLIIFNVCCVTRRVSHEHIHSSNNTSIALRTQKIAPQSSNYRI